MGIEQQEGVYLHICKFALEEGVCFQQQAIQLWISSDQNISLFIYQCQDVLQISSRFTAQCTADKQAD